MTHPSTRHGGSDGAHLLGGETVADCSKYRHKIGLDVALEALAEGWRLRRFALAELNAYAAIDRVQRVMQPYIEAVVL